jgi:Tfp pilus assembly protein PilF
VLSALALLDPLRQASSLTAAPRRLGGPKASPPKAAAISLRNLGLAQLENEQPDRAAETFRKLVPLAPSDPLAYADLAVAALRLQQSEVAAKRIGEALQRAPGRADLLAIQGAILQWGGRNEESLAAYRGAAAAAPERVDVQYSLLRQAQTVGGPAGEGAQAVALASLVRLRADNLVVLLQAGQRAIGAGDRAGATQAFLRVREIAGEAGPQVETAMKPVLQALDVGDLAAARVPAVRLENVLRPSPPYQQGLKELSPGILGLPVERFTGEPAPTAFGDPLPVTFRSALLAAEPTAGQALAAGDFDGDGKTDLVRVRGGASPRIEVLLAAAGWKATAAPPASGIERLLAIDLDNDGNLDVMGYGPRRLAFFRGGGDGTLAEATAATGWSEEGAASAAASDYDMEGDLDLVTLGGKGGAAELLRNPGQGTPARFEKVGKGALPNLALGEVAAVVATDLDRDGDPDLVIAHAKGIAVLDNLRQGRFGDATAARGLAGARPALALAAADFDNDGLPDVAVAGPGLGIWRNVAGKAGTKLVPWTVQGLPATGRFTSIVAFDADNDGRLDLAAAGPDGVVIFGQRGPRLHPTFQPLAVAPSTPAITAPGALALLVAADLDGDGDLDLAAGGPAGLYRFENLGGNRNHWLDVRLQGLEKGNGKNNRDGLGATLELRAGTAYQFREVAAQTTHLGLGRLTAADALRVVWTNGVPQDRLQPKGDQRVVEEQVLKGSCPFLYAWDGERYAFVTDLLWNSPIGLPVAPGVYAPADPEELVRIDGLAPSRESAGTSPTYLLSITEELWEAAFFDSVRLWVVDHPEDVEVASSLRVVPGSTVRHRVLGSRELRSVAVAWDGAGEDVTDRVARRDEVYAAGYERGPYQGASRAWTFTFDLGAAPARPIRLHLDGWIFPADASLNLALAQREDFPNLPPRLEVETATGWETLVPGMGFPAGKTKTMVVDTPPLPPGAHRLRIVTSLWLAWDRIAWTTEPADDAPVVVALLTPAAADLHARGFSALVRRAPNAPHSYDYGRSTKVSPWLPFPGRYTRYGDVRLLLEDPDDRSVVMAPGDEIRLAFDAGALPEVKPGWRRTLFLESHGWDKDADRNTGEAQQVEPLPFRAMKAYGDLFPDTPALRDYRRRWLTRVVEGAPGAQEPER